MKKRLFFGLFLLSFHFFSFAQSDTIVVKQSEVLIFADSLFSPNKDTLVVISAGVKYRLVSREYAKSDQFYDSLRVKAYKNEITKGLYDLFLKYQPPQDVFTNNNPTKSESFFEPYEDKEIKSIRVVKVDMFEGTVMDTTVKAQTGFGKLTNKLHNETKDKIVLKNILFGVNDRVNSYQIADSERIVRSLAFIEDARIFSHHRYGKY